MALLLRKLREGEELMRKERIPLANRLLTAFSLLLLLFTGSSLAQQTGQATTMDPAKARVVEYWSSERRAAAIPRDLRIDARGLGYLRRPDGSLQPYGHQISAEVAGNGPVPNARPGGGNNDTAEPVISNMNPAEGALIGASQTFSATVTDNVGVKSVTFTIRYPNGSTTQSFSANAVGDYLWSVSLSGFTDGNWSWWVTAKDTAKQGGNTANSATVNFSVDTGGGGSGGGGSGGNDGAVANAEWTGGAVQTAAGRLYFEMPNNAKQKGPWNGYVCSGTAIADGVNDRSMILTAAHCVYDDANGAFARNVLFIPNQAATTGSGTDLNCSNDPLGCWVPSFGVVDTDWTASVFPDNIPWDYAFYVVDVAGAHEGAGAEQSLEVAAGTLSINFSQPPTTSVFTHALGYSYDDDPDFMYCADDMTTEGADNWWLAICGLSGGSSGGPWVQPMDAATGIGPVISVNSWGYVGSPGMAGPDLHGSSAVCIFNGAVNQTFSTVPSTDGDAGVALACP